MAQWLPEWLFEGQATVYAILAVALIILVIVWKQTPRPAYMIACITMAVLIGLYCLLDFLVQTDREQIAGVFRQVSAGVEAHNVDQIFSQVSDTYNRHGVGKLGFRQATAGVIEGRHVDQVVIWDWEFAPDYKQKESASDQRENTARVRFMAKPIGAGGQNLFQVHAVMHRDADGKWRLQSWEAFDPFHESDTPIHVPRMD